MSTPRTLYDKIFDEHVVDRQEDGTCLLYIDRHLVHEVTSPQAFEGLRLSGRKVRAPEKTLAVVDHNVPTTDRSKGISDPESRVQVEQLAANAREFGIDYFDAADVRQGIVHIIGPEQGFTLPGTTIVCGGRTDSLTNWDGATGAVSARLTGAIATNVVPKTARLATSRTDPGRHDIRTPTLEVDLEAEYVMPSAERSAGPADSRV